MNDPADTKQPQARKIDYNIPGRVQAEEGSSYGVGYIYLQDPAKLARPVKTIIVQDQNGKERGIHIDIDANGSIYGIEVMSLGLLPPNPADS